MSQPIKFKSRYSRGCNSHMWQMSHISKPRKILHHGEPNGECKTLVPADPAKLAAYRASLGR